MDTGKALGPNGLNSAFYSRFWDLYGPEIFNASKEWLDNGNFSPSINDTHICLIPKKDDPLNLQDWRPISLCNVVFLKCNPRLLK